LSKRKEGKGFQTGPLCGDIGSLPIMKELAYGGGRTFYGKGDGFKI